MSAITATCRICKRTVVLPDGIESGFCPRCGVPLEVAAAEAAPVEAAPFKAEPVRAVPDEATPVKAASFETETFDTASYRPEPYRSEPYKPEPYKPELFKPEPYSPEPIRSAPHEPDPFDVAPSKSEPYKPAPYESAPYESDPFDVAPFKADLRKPAPYEPEPSKPAPYESDPFKPDPYEPNPYEPVPQQQGSKTWQPEEPQKPKRRLKLWIIAAAAVVIIALAATVTVAAFSGGSSYARAEASFFKELFSAAPVSASKGKQFDITASYTAGDYIGIPDMKVDASIQSTKGQAMIKGNLTADGDKLSNVTICFDGTYATISLPDITNYYLKFATSGYNGYGDENLDFSKLDMDQLQKTLESVIKSYFNQVEKYADVDKGVELSGGDVSVTCDKYTIDFTGEFIGEILYESLSAIKKNRNLVSFLGDFSEQIYRDPDRLMEELEESADNLRDGRNSRERLFRMTVWIKDNKVIARKIDRIQYDDDTRFSYQWLVSGKAAYIDFDMKVGYSFSASLKGSFEKSGSGWSGTPKVTVTDYYDKYSFKIAFKDMRIDGGKLIGSVKAEGEIDGTPFDVNLKFDNKNKQQTLTASGEVDNDDIGKWSIAYGAKDIGKVTLPALKRSNEVLGYGTEDYDSRDNRERGEEMRAAIQDEVRGYKRNGVIYNILWELIYSIPD